MQIVALNSLVAASCFAAQPGLTTCNIGTNTLFSGSLGVSPDGNVIIGLSGTPATCAQLYEPDIFRWTPQTGAQRLIVLSGAPDCMCYSSSMSDDGRVIAGWTSDGGNVRAFRWTPEGGMATLWQGPASLANSAYAVTPDGTVLAGARNGLPVRWTAAGTTELPRAGYIQASATGLSSDSRIIVGFGVTAAGEAHLLRWTDGAAPEPLGMLMQGWSQRHLEIAVSRDGRVIAGSRQTAGRWRAFRWTDQQGFVDLDLLPGATESVAQGLSADGVMVLGYCFATPGSPEGCLWPNGEPRVQTVRGHLTVAGVNVPPTAMFYSANAITPDGNVLVGRGRVPGYLGGAFRAQLRPCYADCDGSLVSPALNVSDYICFMNRYAAALPLTGPAQVRDYANCDGSTAPPVLTVADFICFTNFFAAGCP